MKAKDEIYFPPFRLDLVKEQLFRREQQLKVRAKNFSVLRELVEHAGQTVRKEDLIKAIWGEYVEEGVLKQSILKLREQLEDDAKKPQFIETVPGGYRFIAKVQYGQPKKIPNFVGRSEELMQLQHWTEQAKRGERQVIFVTGEPGIGKTTLIDAFVAELMVDPHVWVGRGQCIEHYGEGEAYLPILEALTRLGQQLGEGLFSSFLGRHAPTWLMQLPSLIDATKLEELQRKAQGSTQQRMLREFVAATEISTWTDGPQEPPLLVFVIEDLQWSDHSTLDLIAALARRSGPARLLVLGTFRPAEGLIEGHPLRAVLQELRGHKHCCEISLPPFQKDDVSDYLEQRFPTSTLPTRLPFVLNQVTEGNPLFLVALIDDLVEQGVLMCADGHWAFYGDLNGIESKIPDSIRQLVGKQIDRLTTQTQRILEAGSVAGLEFSAAAVSAAIKTDTSIIEEHCNALADRNHFLQKAGVSEWPDGTLSARYRFRHALYQQLWQERVTVSQNPRLHLRIAECQEAAYGSRAREIAAELAAHFEGGKAYERAIHYLQQAASNAMRRSSYQEAISLLTKGDTLFKNLPTNPARFQQELDLQVALGSALMVIKGYGSSDAARVYDQARELSRHVGVTPRLFSILRGLGRFYIMRAEYKTAREIGQQLLDLAQTLQTPDRLLEGHQQLGNVFFHIGDPVLAHAHLEQAVALYNPADQNPPGSFYGQDLRITCLALEPLALWIMGYPNKAFQCCQEALTLSRSSVSPYSRAFALSFSASFFYYLCELTAIQQQAEELVALATAQDFPLWLAQGMFWQGWVLSEQGQVKAGLAQMRQAITHWQDTGATLGLPFELSCLALAYKKAGKVLEGLKTITEAITKLEQNGEGFWEAEIYRLKGELLLTSSKRQSAQKERVEKRS